MTPKEKAYELRDKFHAIHYMSLEMAKESALIAVGEIIKQNVSTPDDYGASWTYWMQVKQEIENI